MIKIKRGPLQKLLKKLWTQKTHYGDISPLKHGLAERAANIIDKLTETLEECLSINLRKMAIAATVDKKHIQQMSNTEDELLAVVKNQQRQIDELINKMVNSQALWGSWTRAPTPTATNVE